MAVNIGESFTRKIGPLPAWGWGIAVGGAWLGYRMLRGGGGGLGSGKDTQIVAVPGGVIPVSPNFTDELSEAVFGLNERIDELMQSRNNNVDDGEQMPGPTPVPPTTSPYYSGAARYNHATGVWTVSDWQKLTVDEITDILFAHSVGRGTQTGEERKPWRDRIGELMRAGMSNLDIHNKLSPVLATYRTPAVLAGKPIPAPDTTT